jgi:hypothetical protein
MTDIKPLIDRCRNLMPGEEMPTERLIREAGLDPEDRVLYKTVANALSSLPASVGIYKIGRKGHPTRFIRASNGASTPTTPATSSAPAPVHIPAPQAVLAPLVSKPLNPLPSPAESMPDEHDEEHTVTTVVASDPAIVSVPSSQFAEPPPASTLATISHRVDQTARTNGFVVMTAQLRPGMYIPFGLPKDVTQAEIDRIVMFLQNLQPSYRDMPNNAEISTHINDATGRSIL